MTAAEAVTPTVAAAPAVVPAVSLQGVGRRFGDQVVLEDLDLEIAPGEFVVLLGHSGCGKSTLLRIVAGLDSGSSGEAVVAVRRAVAFQSPRLLPWKRVWRNVVLGLDHGGRAEALAALAEVRLEHRADAWPATLSGGEAQRASLARALVREPDLLLLDEPFGALDALTRLTAQGLVADLWARRRPAVLLVTHDVDEAIRLADRVLVMDHGRIEHDIPVDLPRPRDLDDHRYVVLRRRLLADLGVDA